MPDASPGKPVFEVVNPVGEEELPDLNPANTSRINPAAPLADLSGKKIGLVWSAFRNGNVFLDAIEGLLSKRFSDVEFVRLPGGKGLQWGDRPHESLGELGTQSGVNGAIAAAAG